MAKSQIGRLRAIEQREARAREMLKQIQREREKVVAPTRAKIEAIFGRVLSEVVRERLEAIVGLRLNQAALEKDLREAIERHLPLRGKVASERPSSEVAAAEVAAAAEEDDLSLQIARDLDNVGEVGEAAAPRS